MTEMIAVGSERSKFDVPAGIAYFNTAYNAPLLNASRDRLTLAAAAKSRPWQRTPPDFFDDAERVRCLAADLFGGTVAHYAIVPAASYGVSTAARAIEPTLGAGDAILLLAEEFPSNVLPWRRVAAETGATILTVDTPPDGNWTQAVLDRLVGPVRVAALPQVHWTNGARLDLVAISAACRTIGAAPVLDVTQSLGAMPLDLDAIHPDFMVAAGYKWLLAPYGFGLLYVDTKWHDARPLEETWLARENAENFAGLTVYSDTYRTGARRFDVGETCATTILPGVLAALEQLQDWGIANIGQSIQAINRDLIDHLRPLGCHLPPAATMSPHMFGFNLPGHYTGDLVKALHNRGIYVSQRGRSIRIAPHLHNSIADIEILVEAARSALRG